MALLDEIREKKPQLLALAARYGVCDIRVFGSVARGEERPDSDVDLLIAVEPGVDAFAVGGFQMDASDILGRFVHLSFQQGQNQALIERLLQGARPL